MAYEFSEIIRKLSEIQTRLLIAQKLPPRLHLNQINLNQQKAAVLVGPRGVGKTSFLLREAEKLGNMLYLSADHPLISTAKLWDLGEQIFLSGYDGLMVDEVHYAADWSRQLKGLYDSFPNKIIWASDSSSIVLRQGIGDLSRRFIQYNIPLLSLREYIALRKNLIIDVFDPLESSRKTFENILKQINVLAMYRDYIREGFRPIFLEGDYRARLLAIIEKMITQDVPFFVPSIQDNHLRLMHAVIGHLALSQIPTVNVDSLCAQWSISKEKLYQLLSVMEAVGLINIVRLKSDHKATGKGAKIFLADPSMYDALDGNLGHIREAFVVAAFKAAGKSVYAADKDAESDFVIDNKFIEVGGKGKKAKKADYVIRDDTELPSAKTIPMWSLGMMY